MKTTTENLIADLVALTRQNLTAAEQSQNMDLETLNYKPAADSWSVLECFAHLNFYGDFYLPEIERRIDASKHPAESNFKAGLLGDYFAKMMLPGEKMKTMKTLKSTNPNGNTLTKSTIEKFIQQQKKTEELLYSSRRVSLNKTRASISIAPMLKLKLGDTFRILIYHNQRHVQQAYKVLELAKNRQRVAS